MKNPWIFGREAARLLCVRFGKLPEIAEAGNVRRLTYPGQWVRYHRGDILDLVASSVQGQGREKAGVA